MEAAWASAVALQGGVILEDGALVVVRGDPYTWIYRTNHPLYRRPHISRPGQEVGEPRRLIRDVDGSFAIVALEIIALAMARHTSGNLLLVQSADDVIGSL